MIIVRRYDGESQWETVDEQTARKVLARFYLDVDMALADIAAGEVVRTSAAEYKQSPRTE